MDIRLSLVRVSIGHAFVALALSRFWSDSSFVHLLLKTSPIALTVYVVFWCWIYPFYLSPLRHIPTIPGSPLLGHLWTYVINEMGVPQRQWHKDHGGIVRYFFPLGIERLSIADDNALRHMTVINPYNYQKPLSVRRWIAQILGEGVLVAEGNEHVRQRKALSPAFSTQSIRALQPRFWQKALQLADKWRSNITDKSPSYRVEILDWINRTTLDIIGQAAFGTDINSLDQPDAPLRDAYRRVFAFDFVSRAILGLQMYIWAVRYIPLKINRELPLARAVIVNEASRIVRCASQESGKSSGKDVMSLIVRENERAKDTGGDLSFDTMRDQVMTFLGAGHDTTATAVAWTLHLLSKHTDVQSKLRAEIKQFMPNLFDPNTRHKVIDQLDKFDVDQLPYLRKVCRESLRFIPPIPTTTREPVEDDHLGGYFVPKGTRLGIFINTLNRLPRYWGETADVFWPDRWDNLLSTFDPNADIPFLQGPRSCIGRKFAETEMKVLLCSLLSMFEFQCIPGGESPEDSKMWRVVLRPRDGITLQLSLVDSFSS